MSLPEKDLQTSRGRRVVLIVLGLYIVGLVVLLAMGRFAFFPKEIALPVLFLPPALSGQFRRFIGDWAIFLALVVMFDALRGLVFATVSFLELREYMMYVIKLERFLLGGQVLPVILQHAWLDGIGVFEKFLVVVHASHFVMFLGLGMVIWYWRREAFGQFKASFILLIYLGLIVYLLVPTVPPWMAAQFEVIPPTRRIAWEVYNSAMPEFARGFATNPIAAMPSLHAAIAVLLAAIAVKHFRLKGLPVVLYALLVILSITYFGEHYLVDVIAGVALSAFVYWIIYHSRIGRWRPKNLSNRWATSMAPEWQRLILAGVLLVMTVAIAHSKSELESESSWYPSKSFVESELVPNSPDGQLYLGTRLYMDHDFPGALAAFERLPMSRHNPASLRMYIFCAFELGQRERGRKLLSVYMAGAADQLSARFFRAMILFEFGEIDREGVEQAISELQRSFPGPKSEDYVKRLRELLDRGRPRGPDLPPQ